MIAIMRIVVPNFPTLVESGSRSRSMLNPFRMSEDVFANTTLQYVKQFVISGFPNPGNASIQSSYYRDSTLLTAGNVLKQSDDAGIRDVVCPFAPRTSNASPTGHHHAVRFSLVSVLVMVLL